MRLVSTKELSSYKILPFDLYNEANGKVLNAGEVLTPGKLIMLKNYAKLFTEEIFSEAGKGEKTSGGRNSAKKLANFSYDTLETADFETVINRESIIKSDNQVRIKFFYRKTLDLFLQGYYEEGLLKLNSLVSIITGDLYKQLGKSKKGSQIRFLGEFKNGRYVSGVIRKPLLSSHIRTINDQELNAIVGVYDETNKKLLSDYLKTNTPNGEIIFLAADPDCGK